LQKSFSHFCQEDEEEEKEKEKKAQLEKGRNLENLKEEREKNFRKKKTDKKSKDYEFNRMNDSKTK
jgi:hypothetical protein